MVVAPKGDGEDAAPKAGAGLLPKPDADALLAQPKPNPNAGVLLAPNAVPNPDPNAAGCRCRHITNMT